MAQGDIPIEGSAVVGGIFPLKATTKAGQPPNDSILNVSSLGKKLRIFVDNGRGRIFNEPLNETNWKMEIFEDTPANAARHPATNA